jgi:hypothetical protein
VRLDTDELARILTEVFPHQGSPIQEILTAFCFLHPRRITEKRRNSILIMKRRSTFIHDLNIDFNPGEVRVSPEQVSHPGLRAAREERLTYSLDELPVGLRYMLRHSHELHIRWTTESAYDPIAPYLSRTPPGLHAFYTPREVADDDLLCPLLRKTFSTTLTCHSPKRTFTKLDVLSERFSRSASLQYYAPLPSLQQLVAYIQRHICPQSDVVCAHDVSLINIADTLDLDYDSISHTLTVTAFWARPPAALFNPVLGTTTQNQWTIDIRRASKLDRVEIGILSSSPATDAHDLQLSGFLTVIGEDEKPKPTRFSFPSRHHVLPQGESQKYTAFFQQPQGLHPTLIISLSPASELIWPSKRPSDSQCALQAYFVLPSYIFADEYAFKSDDPLFAKSHNIRRTHSISGELDLEAPDYLVDRWGSVMLLELATPVANSSLPEKGWEVTIPLHLRYQEPLEGGQAQVIMPWPIVYWACTAEEGTKFPVNPFDRINLGFDALYGPRTMVYHLEPSQSSEGSSRLAERLTVPVYDTDQIDSNIIEMATLIIVVSGFLWVAAKLVPGITQQFQGGRGASGVPEPRRTKPAKKEQ